MSSAKFTEAWITSADFSDRYQLRSSKQTDEDERLAVIVKELETATVSSKLDFFRSMGLEFSNSCDANHSITDNNHNGHDLQTSSKRACRSSSPTSDTIAESFDAKPEDNFGCVSRSKQSNSRNSKICNMTGWEKTIPPLRECRVTIIGEKCKTCGRSFKCIRDLETHVRRKHRARRSRKKLVIKIGDEVISRLPIKRKHLKWRHRQKQRTIETSDEARSLCRDEMSVDRVSAEEIAPFADRDRNCATSASSWPRLAEFAPEEPSRLELANLRNDEEEEIQFLLKITRPRRSITEMEINHETPNRTERELLLTDAIRDFVAMSDDLVEIVEPARDLRDHRDDSVVIEDYGPRRVGNLDRVEHNCSFHIDNEDDIDCCAQDVSSLLPDNANDYYGDDAASLHSPHYRNENGDIIPDFIDYTHCLSDRPACYNNNVCEYDSLFYNEIDANTWNKTSRDSRDASFVGDETPSESLDSLVLIKEEIILDDLLT